MSKPVSSSRYTSANRAEQASLFETTRPAQPRVAKRGATVEVFCTRSGPKRGEPDQSSVFRTKAEAVEFLVNLHGLSLEESRILKKELALNLNRKWHGSDRCDIRSLEVSVKEAQHLLENGPR